MGYLWAFLPAAIFGIIGAIIAVRSDSARRRRIGLIFVVMVVALALGLGLGAVTSDASAEQGRAPDLGSAGLGSAGLLQAERACAPGDTCSVPPDQWAAKKFRKGKMGTGSWKLSQLAKNPKTAKRIIIRKIAKKVQKQREKAASSRTAEASTNECDDTSVRWECAMAYARERYDDLMAGQNCALYGRYTAYESGKSICKTRGFAFDLENKQFRRSVTVGMCGGTVIVGLLSIPAGAGAGAGAYAAVAVAGSSCSWATYLSWTN